MNRILKRIIAIGTAAVITAVCVSGCTTYVMSGNAKDFDDEITMPNIIGMTLDDVGSKYPDLNLEVERQYSDEYGENTVIDQKIPAGRTIRKSTVVSITVSNGTQKIEIPDLSGTNIEEAMDKLEKMELIPKMIYVENDKTDKDAVIYTEPAAHSEVAKNTLVKLYVSKASLLRL